MTDLRQRLGALANLAYDSKAIVSLGLQDVPDAAAARIAELEAELEKWRTAVGLASTAVPDMEIDVKDPVGMMHEVCGRVNELERKSVHAEKYWDTMAENDRLRRMLKSATSPSMGDYGPDTPKDELLIAVNAMRRVQEPTP